MNIRILITILHDFVFFGISFFVSLWIRLDLNSALNLCRELSWFLILFSFTNIFLLKYMGLYHGIWRYASIHEIISIMKSVSVSILLLLGIFFLVFRLEDIPRSFPILLFIISIFSVTSPRIFYRILKDYLKKNNLKKVPVLVVGDSPTTENFIRFSKKDDNSLYEVVGIISFKESSVGRRIHNIPIISSTNKIESLKKGLKKIKKLPQRIIISDFKIKSEIIESLYIFAKQNGLAIGMLPSISEISNKSQSQFVPKPIVIEDILGRKQKVNDPQLLKDIPGKVVLVTGAGGSIGSELCQQIHRLKPKLLILLEQNEYNLFKISSQLKDNILPSLTDIKDFSKMKLILKKFKPDYIFHTAALKHITFVEKDPIEALYTNFLATVKLCQLCKILKIKKMIFISTDKAVNPSNIMGASKRLCEKYIQQIASNEKDTIFTIVRFGNVLGSTGSVVPVFEKQISEGGPVKITHPKIRRFFMTIREAVELVLISSQLKISENGKIFILEMGDSIYIKDLAKRMIILSGADEKNIKIQFTGLRKGEKLNEELFFNSEKIDKTEINGILSTTSKLFCPKNSDFNKLIQEITNKRNESSLKIFEKMLPEYIKE